MLSAVGTKYATRLFRERRMYPHERGAAGEKNGMSAVGEQDSDLHAPPAVMTREQDIGCFFVAWEGDQKNRQRTNPTKSIKNPLFHFSLSALRGRRLSVCPHVGHRRRCSAQARHRVRCPHASMANSSPGSWQTQHCGAGARSDVFSSSSSSSSSSYSSSKGGGGGGDGARFSLHFVSPTKTLPRSFGSYKLNTTYRLKQYASAQYLRTLTTSLVHPYSRCTW